MVLACLLGACSGDGNLREVEPSSRDGGDAGLAETGTASQLCDDFLVPPCMTTMLVNNQCVVAPDVNGTECPITSGPHGVSFGTCANGVCKQAHDTSRRADDD